MENILDLLTSAKAAIEEVEMLLPNFDKTVVKYRNTCLDCRHWLDNEDICGYYKQKPPAVVIVRPEGQCGGFDINIPF